MRTISSAVFIFAGTFALGGATLRAADMTLTGTVADAMCGVKHMSNDAVACTKACVKKGSNYALVVKDKAYTLIATDAQKAELDTLAGKMAEVNGDVTGSTVTVKSVKMGTTKK
jgi:hypothetical protein